jgi:hypothetical protein
MTDHYKLYEGQNLGPLRDRMDFDGDLWDFVKNGGLEEKEWFTTIAPWVKHSNENGREPKGRFISVRDTKEKSKKLVKCYMCGEEFDQSHYTVNQWTKPAPKCMKCVAKLVKLPEDKAAKK